jgi:hypothetical protein
VGGGIPKENVKKKSSRRVAPNQKKSAVANYLSDVVQSFIKSEIEKHMSS